MRQDDLGRAAGSGVPFTFQGEDLILPPITFAIIGEVRQYLLSQRKSGQQVLVEHLDALGDRVSDELKEKMIQDSMTASRKLAVITDEELGAYIDTSEGLALTVWLAFERRYPGKFAKDEVIKIVEALNDDDTAALFQIRDQAAGLDERGNSTGRQETEPPLPASK